MEEPGQPLHHDYVFALKDEEAYLQQTDEKKPEIVEPFDPASIVCQFCGKSFGQVPRLFEAKRRVRDPNTGAIVGVWICDECVARMAQVLAEEPEEPAGTRRLWWHGWWLGATRT
jgi:hypothetical protein